MIGVVIPAHNEQASLADCLASVIDAARHVALKGESISIVVVLDACLDDSAAIAQRCGVSTLVIDQANVGIARHVGAQHLIERGARWLAFTDADTIVQPDWLARQLGSRADAVCGGIHLRGWRNLPVALQHRYLLHRRCVTDGRHIHGANMGICADAYQFVGGFAPLTAHEDVALVEALQGHGFSVVWLKDMRVLTSSRRIGRAPEGLGHLLHSLESQLSISGSSAEFYGNTEPETDA